MLRELDARGVAVTTWEASGNWSGENPLRWHITSHAISSEGFPALRYLERYSSVPYALSLHGYTNNSQKGVLVGGDAPQDIKCTLVQAIEDHLSDNAIDPSIIGYRIFADGQDDLDVNIDLAEKTGLEGEHQDNIVNRLPSLGGIQLEMTGALREDDDLFPIFLAGVAAGMDEIIANGAQDVCDDLTQP